MNDSQLAFGLEWDRDYFVSFAKTFRMFFWPVSVFFVHPFTIFAIIRKSTISFDFKIAFVVHHMFLMCFDFYNGALYQMYPLVPIPAFICTGLLCRGETNGATLLTGLSIWTISLCVPYLFIMLRMYQKILFQGSCFKVNNKSQALILLLLASVLLANVFGFNYWAVEPWNKQDIVKKPEIAWAANFTTNFLVLGEKEGDVGSFAYELILLVVSIFINFSFYVFITYHSVHMTKRIVDLRKSKAREAQLRFVYSLTVQACCSALLFILPMLLLFVALFLVRSRSFFPGWLVALFRVTMLLAYNCCSIAHSLVYLSRNTWFIQTNAIVGRASIAHFFESRFFFCSSSFLENRDNGVD